jgi:hypothetical protein
VDGLIASVPGVEVADRGDLALDLGPGQVAAGAGLGPLPALEVEGLHAGDLVEAPAEARRGVLVEVARALGLLLGEHAALAGGDAGAGLLGAAGEGDLRLLAEGAEAHVADEDRDLEAQRPFGARADDELGGDRGVVEQRLGGELAGDDLDVDHCGSSERGTPMAETAPWWPSLVEAVARELLDVADLVLLGAAVDVGVEAEVLVALELLRVLARRRPSSSSRRRARRRPRGRSRR